MIWIKTSEMKKWPLSVEDLTDEIVPLKVVKFTFFLQFCNKTNKYNFLNLIFEWIYVHNLMHWSGEQNWKI